MKSGKAYRRHVALNNLLRSVKYDIPRAYVLCEGNVAEESIVAAGVTRVVLHE
ncbi:MAG: hypothetical protein IJ092_05815 [Atopobiaceae bacterium]|nr:hypothetical protein [Atopobiaceae bacterium]